MFTRSSKAALILSVVAITTTICSAQTVTGTIGGEVTDPSGQNIAGATVKLTNDATKETRSAQTTNSGEFAFQAVQPGTYSVRVEAAGFRAFEKTNNVLTAAERLPIGTVVLQIGSLAETVTVVAEGAAVQTDSSEHSALLSSNQLADIAVRGRDPMSLIRILPGVSYQGESESPGGSFGSGIPNIQGQRNSFSSVSVDGLVGNDLGSPNVFSSTVNLDAIGEVKVLLNNYQAEYGRNAGASINIVTKSGTRDFHGSAYWYARNDALNANDFFNNRNGVRRALYRYNTVGFTIGGPVTIPKLFNRNREKIFFFWSFEDSQTKNPQALRQYTMPTALERIGDFSQSLDVNGRLIPVNDPTNNNQPFAGNVVPPSRIDPNGQALLNVFPAPNALDRNITKGTYNYNFQESINVPKYNHVIRTDYRPSDKDFLYVRTNIWKSDQQGYAVAAGGSNWGLTRQHYTYTDNGIVLDYTRILSPSMTNEFLGGARHGVEKGPALSDTELARVQRSATGFKLGQLYPQINPLGIIPQASFGGVTNAPGIGYDSRYPLRGADTLFNFSDTFSWVKAAHTIKAGMFYDHARNYEGESGTFAGNFNFGRDVNNPNDSNYAYANALLGNFTSYTESNSRPSTEGRFTSMAWFVQDTWKVTRRLTLDFGVRVAWYSQNYQNSGLAAAFALERYDVRNAPALIRPALSGGRRVGQNPLTGAILPAIQIGSYAPNSGNVTNGLVTATDPNYPRGFVEQQPPLPEPRIGFAYDPFGDGKTAIRGGFGIFHNTRPPGGLLRTGFSQTAPIQFNPIVYYGSLNTLLSSPGVLFPNSVTAIDKQNKTPASYNLSLEVQRQIGRATIVNVGYVSTLGRHLDQVRNLNLVPYGARFLASNADPASPGVPLNDNFFRPIPGFANVSYRENASSSNYHALQAQINRRFAQSLQFGVAYTWSKAMDFVDADGGTVATYRPIRVWNYGKAGFDQTHVMVINYVWDLPKATRLVNNKIVGAAFNNWQVSGITAFVSGTPVGIGLATTDAVDFSGGGDGTRVNVTGKAQKDGSERTFAQWFNPTVFARPGRGDTGNAPKDVFRGPGVSNWDITLFKNVPLGGDKRQMQFRWEFYNTFNHTQYSGVDNTARFDPAGNQVNPTFGQITSTRSPRIMQGSLRFRF